MVGYPQHVRGREKVRFLTETNVFVSVDTQGSESKPRSLLFLSRPPNLGSDTTSFSSCVVTRRGRSNRRDGPRVILFLSLTSVFPQFLISLRRPDTKSPFSNPPSQFVHHLLGVIKNNFRVNPTIESGRSLPSSVGKYRCRGPNVSQGGYPTYKQNRWDRGIYLRYIVRRKLLRLGNPSIT